MSTKKKNLGKIGKNVEKKSKIMLKKKNGQNVEKKIQK